MISDAERYALITSMSVGTIVLSRRFATLRIYNELVLRKEFICHLHGRIEVAARVVAQVDDEIGESSLRKVGKSNEEFGVGCLAEVLYSDVTRLVVKHVSGGDALLGDVASCHGKVLDGLLSVAHHADFHLCVLRTFKAVHRLFVCHFLADKWFPIDAHNLVAGKQARSLCRTVLDYVLHMYRVLAYRELDAHAGERTAQVVGGSLHILGTDIDGVRVEIGENLRYRLIDKRIDVHLIDILVVDNMQEIGEAVASRIDDIESVSRKMVGIESADKDADDDAYSHQQRHKPVVFIHFHCPRGLNK